MNSDLVSVMETLSVSIHNRKSKISSDGVKRAGTRGLSEAAPSKQGVFPACFHPRGPPASTASVTRTVGSASSCLCEDTGLPGDVFPTVCHWLTWGLIAAAGAVWPQAGPETLCWEPDW